MKKKKQPFASQYPYLAYWVKEWGFMKIGNTEYTQDNESFLTLIDDNDIVYEGDMEDSIDETLKKAEKYLRKVVAPEQFDEEIIEALEEDYKNRD